MTVATNCPDCEKKIRVPRLGIRIKCPHCESKVLLPDDQESNASVVNENPDTNERETSFDFLDPPTADGFDTTAVHIGTEASENTAGVNVAANAISEQAVSEPVVSKSPRKLKKRRKVADEDPPNPFRQKWYSNLFRPRKILKGEPAPSTLPFKLLAGYAIAVTAALIYLMLTRSHHALESLPDLKPQTAAEYRHVPEDTVLPEGHELKLGQSQQYGNVIVRPIRVTRSPVEFVHYENATNARDAEEPALKLWLEFTVTSDRAFAPLDTLLLTKRAMRPDQPDVVLANTFLCKVSDRVTRRDVVLNYEHPVNSEWLLKDQNINQAFQPGDRNVSYVASDVFGYEDLLQQKEPLVWRLQLRKGVSSDGNGVTTLVDVVFHPDDITKES